MNDVAVVVMSVGDLRSMVHAAVKDAMREALTGDMARASLGDDIVTVQMFAKRRNVSEKTVLRWIARGMPVHRDTRPYGIPFDRALKWLEET